MNADLLDDYIDRVTALQLQRAALLRMLELLLADPHAPELRTKAARMLVEATAMARPATTTRERRVASGPAGPAGAA